MLPDHIIPCSKLERTTPGQSRTFSSMQYFSKKKLKMTSGILGHPALKLH